MYFADLKMNSLILAQSSNNPYDGNYDADNVGRKLIESAK